jgi:hypothetical protein
MSRYTLSISKLAEIAEGSSHMFLHPLSLRKRVRKGGDSSQLQSAIAGSSSQRLEGSILGCGGDPDLFLASQEE